MGRFRLLWLSLFILFYFILFYFIALNARIQFCRLQGEKVRVAYIDFSRLTHCQVAVGLSKGGSKI
jgi:hypothetical protein